MKPLVEFMAVSGTAYSVRRSRWSALTSLIGGAGLDERASAEQRMDVANLSFKVEVGDRLFCSGSFRAAKTMLSLLSGLIRPISGRILLNGTVLSAAQFERIILSNSNITVINAVRMCIETHFSNKLYGVDPEGILSYANLISFSFVKLNALSFAQVKALAIALMIFSSSDCLVCDEESFTILGAHGAFLGEQVSLSASTVIFVTNSKTPRWFQHNKELILP